MNDTHQFPKYTREQKLNAKLSEKEVEKAKELRKSGLSYRALAQMFGMSAAGIYYSVADEDTQKRINQRRQAYPGGGKDFKKYRQRKLEILPELKEYEKLSSKEYKKEHHDEILEKQRERDRAYYENNKEKKLASNQKWREANREYLRLKAAAYRIKKKEEANEKS